MTGPSLAASTRRADYVANAGQTVFAYSFPIAAAADLRVVRTRAGAQATLVLSTDYSVQIGTDGTGTVTLAAGALAGDAIAVIGRTEISRQVSYQTGGDLFAATLNADIRKAYVILQELSTRIGRVVRLADGDLTSELPLPLAAERAGKFLAFDGAGAPYAATPVDVAGASAFAQTLLDDPDAAAFLATLGFGAFAAGLRALADAAAMRAAIGAVAKGGDTFAGANFNGTYNLGGTIGLQAGVTAATGNTFTRQAGATDVFQTGSVLRLADAAPGVWDFGSVAKAFRSGTQTITPSTWTSVQWDASDLNVGGAVSGARFQPNKAGWYEGTFTAGVAGGAMATFYIRVLLNGTTPQGQEGVTLGGGANQQSPFRNVPWGPIYFNGVNTYIEGQVIHDNGGNLNIEVANKVTRFSAKRVY